MSKNLENFLMKNMILIENLLKNSKIKMMNVNIRNYLMIQFRNNSKKLNRFKNKEKDKFYNNKNKMKFFKIIKFKLINQIKKIEFINKDKMIDKINRIDCLYNNSRNKNNK